MMQLDNHPLSQQSGKQVKATYIEFASYWTGISMLDTIRQKVWSSPTRALPSAVTAAPSASCSSQVKVPMNTDNSVYGYLVLESSKGVEKERFPLRKQITTVGRMQQCDIRIYQETISRLHCQVCVDDNGNTTLEVFNPRGVRINRQKVQALASTSHGKSKIYPLQESDLVEIFSHFFRLESPQFDEGGTSQLLNKGKSTGRKSFRMSLIRATIDNGDGINPLKEIQGKQVEDKDANVEPPCQIISSPEKKVKADSRMFEEDRENVPVKGRRSFVLSTPSRQATHQGPWETEPRKKRVRRVSLSPVKGSFLRSGKEEMIQEGDSAFVVMEEVDDEELEAESQKLLEDNIMETEPVVPIDEVSRPKTPPTLEVSSERLTKSSSPKKPRRRSSFFGRAGIFAGMNFGFYPEERKETEEEKKVEEDVQGISLLSPPSSPTKQLKQMMPEPRLDADGMPRLPRSMSSPSGLNYGSPGKRRNISLRTATLLKTSQQVFEQQKLLSPPSSPTKSSSTNTFSSLMTPVGSNSPERQLSPSQVPLPESDDDADIDDEDEVDKSLNSLTEEQSEEDKGKDKEEFTQPMPKYKLHTGPRKSHGVLDSFSKDEKAKAKKGKGRVSMPGTLVSVSLIEENNDELVEEWQREWRERSQKGNDERIETALYDAFDKAQDEDTDEEEVQGEGDGGVDEEQQKAVEDQDGDNVVNEVDTAANDSTIPTPPCPMLRHLVRSSPKLIALLDEVTGIPVLKVDADGDVSTLALPTAASHLEEHPQMEDEKAPNSIDEQRHLETKSRTEKEKNTCESSPPHSIATSTPIPKELQSSNVDKPMRRRASEQAQRKTKRRSSVGTKTTNTRRSRKSEGQMLTAGVDRVTPMEVEEKSCVISLVATKESVVGSQVDLVDPTIVVVGSATKEEQKDVLSTPASQAKRRSSGIRSENATSSKKPLPTKTNVVESPKKRGRNALTILTQPTDQKASPCTKVDETVKEAPKQSPRKRTTDIVETNIPTPLSRQQKKKGRKEAAEDATPLETDNLSSTKSAPAKVIRKTRSTRAATKQAESTSDAIISSDDLQSSDTNRLIIEPSSPVKRTKRAAKQVAEEKIKQVLIKKPSVTVLRDARSLSSEAGKGEVNNKGTAKAAATRSSTRIPRKATELSIQSEPLTRTRTTRSRAAAAATKT